MNNKKLKGRPVRTGLSAYKRAQRLTTKNYDFNIPETSKNELFSVTDESFQSILKTSKILDGKEFKFWEWKAPTR